MNGPFAKAHRKIKILNKNKKNDNYIEQTNLFWQMPLTKHSNKI